MAEINVEWLGISVIVCKEFLDLLRLKKQVLVPAVAGKKNFQTLKH